jgi:hypothetical protein
MKVMKADILERYPTIDATLLNESNGTLSFQLLRSVNTFVRRGSLGMEATDRAFGTL